MAKAKAAAKRKISISLADVFQIAFWVVIPILVFSAFFLTSRAKSMIREKYTTRKTEVETEKANVEKIASNANHPNDKTIEAIVAEKEELAQNIYTAWQTLYQNQKARNHWPRELSREFLEIVEKAKFRAPIGVGKPYILEDYAYFMPNNLPELIKHSNRRRSQVRDYQFIEEPGRLGMGRFEPVWVDPVDGILYAITKETNNVYSYDPREDILRKVEVSHLRDRLLGITEREPYYREMDPMIVDPWGFVSGGGGRGGFSGGGAGGSMGGAPGGMGGRPGGAGGMMGGGSVSTPMAGSGNTAIPGDNIDPAAIQINNLSAVQRPENMVLTNGEIFPGLPPYIERRRIVGNIDWLSPEIFKLVSWSKGQVPRSIEIWYLQEDLWVYDALISVLVETNKDSPNNIAVVPIKCIEQMLIGQDAASAWSTIKSLSTGVGGESPTAMAGGLGDMDSGMSGPGMGGGTGSSLGGGFGMGGSGLGGMGSGLGGMGGGFGMGGSSTGQSSGLSGLDEGERAVLEDILNGRYLDAEDNPLEASASPPYAEFKRMPIVLKLVVDQLRIPDVLVNCANCSMPIDIRHVRICPDKAGRVSVGGMGGGGMGDGGMSGGGMRGGMSDGGPGRMGGGNPRGSASRSASSMGGPPGGSSSPSGGGIGLGRSELGQSAGYGTDAIRIEIYGVINIFNEPNPDDFGTGVAEVEPPAAPPENSDGTVSEGDGSLESGESSVVGSVGEAPSTSPAGSPSP